MNLVLDPAGPKFVGYYGGYGSGKSLILCITMLSQGVIHGGEYVIARHHMPELRRTTWKQFIDIIPKELIVEIRVADAEVHVKSATGKPAIFYFVGLDEPGKLDSLNLSGAGIDEASYTTEEAFLKLQGRIRNPRGLRKIIIVGNPKGKNWVYRRFVKKEGLATPEAQAKYAMIVAPSTENIHLDTDYIQNMLESYSAERIQRDIYGSWDSFEGQIFSEFKREVHVIKPFAIPKDWIRAVGADHGFTNPAAWIWGATDYDGNIYIYREFYQSGWTIEEICKGRAGEPGVATLNNKEKIEGVWMDPSTKATRGQTGASDWDTYLDHLPKGIYLNPAKNEVTAGIDRCKEYLKIRPELGNKPKMFIFDTCVNFLDELTQYQWKELGEGQQGKVNQKEEPKKYKDHTVDAWRYLIMSRPEVPKLADKQKKDRAAPTLEGSLQRSLHKIKHPEPKDPLEGY